MKHVLAFYLNMMTIPDYSSGIKLSHSHLKLIYLRQGWSHFLTQNSLLHQNVTFLRKIVHYIFQLPPSLIKLKFTYIALMYLLESSNNYKMMLNLFLICPKATYTLILKRRDTIYMEKKKVKKEKDKKNEKSSRK